MYLAWHRKATSAAVSVWRQAWRKHQRNIKRSVERNGNHQQRRNNGIVAYQRILNSANVWQRWRGVM